MGKGRDTGRMQDNRNTVISGRCTESQQDLPQLQHFGRQLFRDPVILKNPGQRFSPPAHFRQRLDPHDAEGASHL